MAAILDEIVAKRALYNTKILEELTEMLKLHPELRFKQAMIILGIIPDTQEAWFEESSRTFAEIEKDGNVFDFT